MTKRPPKKKASSLDGKLAAAQDSLTFFGERAAERYGDADLDRLAEVPALERLLLGRQHMTRLPVGLPPGLKSLTIRDAPGLVTLAGIERLTSLQSLWLTEVPNLDLEATFALIGELPQLAEVTLGGDSFLQMPRAIAKVCARVVELIDCPRLDFADAFAKLGRVATLRHLRLVQRKRVVLPDALAPLKNVDTFELLFDFSDLPDSLGSMTALERLLLERNRIRALPATIGELGKLREIHVPQSKLTILPDELCDCGSLEVLDVRGNPLKTLPERIGDLANLVRLHASWTKLKKVPASIGQLAKLRHLDLPDADTLGVPDSIAKLQLVEFSGPPKVEQRLTLLPPETPQDDRVYLSEPDRIPADFGDPLVLDLRLPTVSTPLPQLSRLRRVQEITIDVGSLDDALARLATARTLVELTIEGERETLPSSLGKLTQIERLAIWPGSGQSATLKTLPLEIGNLASLKSLALGPMLISALPVSIGNLAALERLQLQLEDLEALPATIGELARLNELALHDVTKLARLPDELARCGALTSVTLDRGYERSGTFANIEVLGRLPALTSLNIWRFAGLNLSSLFEALARGPLQDLTLAISDVAVLPPTIGKLAKLRKLDVERMDLKQLPGELRACEELRSFTLPRSFGDSDAIKQCLPKGRWKKSERSHRTSYERTDLD